MAEKGAGRLARAIGRVFPRSAGRIAGGALRAEAAWFRDSSQDLFMYHPHIVAQALDQAAEQRETGTWTDD